MNPFQIQIQRLSALILPLMLAAPMAFANTHDFFQVEGSASTILEIQGHLDSTPAAPGVGYVLQTISLDFALSSSGVLAPLLSKGNSAVSLEWEPKDAGGSAHVLGSARNSFGFTIGNSFGRLAPLVK
ncbi:MAG: hypothetical protein K2X47_09330, partial [Bdellovibrionales bacterium]|nr:hypothetical protein [Bdellovibrionales bacterium]